MGRIDFAIIGGTGVGERLALLGGKPLHTSTSAGLFRSRMIEFENKKIVLVQRHSAGHRTPPHKVNYKAIALGLKQLGVNACFATAAVGGLRADWPEGTFALCSDFLDLSGRNLTLYEHSVQHTDFTHPFDCSVRDALLQAGQLENIPLQKKAVYVCGNGPRYETPAEIQMIRQLGGDIVGMTATSEAILLREAGIPYACLAVVTNLAAGLGKPELTHEEVIEVMQQSGEKAVRLLLRAVTLLEP